MNHSREPQGTAQGDKADEHSSWSEQKEHLPWLEQKANPPTARTQPTNAEAEEARVEMLRAVQRIRDAEARTAQLQVSEADKEEERIQLMDKIQVLKVRSLTT